MAKTSIVNHSTPVVHAPRAAYGKDLEDWPRSGMGFPKDIPPGEKRVACFRPFLELLIQGNLSRKTIRKHLDNLWILGGEIILHLNETPSLRKVPVEDLVFDVQAFEAKYHRQIHARTRRGPKREAMQKIEKLILFPRKKANGE